MGNRRPARTWEQNDGQYVFQVQVFLGDIGPDAVSVELYAEAKDGYGPTPEPAMHTEHLTSTASAFSYTVRVPATRPVADYTHDWFHTMQVHLYRSKRLHLVA